MKIPKKLKPGNIIEIHWVDHWSSSGWRSPKEVFDQSINCSSVGYYVGQNKNLLFLAASDDYNGYVGSAMGRLKKHITKIRILK